jgi:hypothetical protein
MFDTLEMSLTVMERLAPLEPTLRQRRKSLAHKVGRAAESIALNVSEVQQRARLDRADLFRRAAARQASSPRRCASRGHTATSRPPNSPPSMPCWIGFARCCGGSRIERPADVRAELARHRPATPCARRASAPGWLWGFRRVLAGSRARSRAFQGHRLLRF